MTTSNDLPDVEIAADPAIWLRGPSPDCSEDERRQWLLGAQHAVSTDFDLENAKGGADYRDYVSQVLKVFVAWDTHANVTFLRLRHLGDTPIPVGLELYSPTDVIDIEADPGFEMTATGDTPADRLVEALLASPDDLITVGEISREPVGGSGWERLIYWVEDPDKGVTGLVRHVRHFVQSGVVAAIRFGGLSPSLTIEALNDVDELARGIRIGDEA